MCDLATEKKSFGGSGGGESICDSNLNRYNSVYDRHVRLMISGWPHYDGLKYPRYAQISAIKGTWPKDLWWVVF